jgi:hypothetical protein
MSTFRPAGGFIISMAPAVEALVESHCADNPAFGRYWSDIIDRLRFVAHIEGVSDHRFPTANRIWTAAADEERGLPRVRLILLVMGDRVRIRVASIG